jgi:hypothetical protein
LQAPSPTGDGAGSSEAEPPETEEGLLTSLLQQPGGGVPEILDSVVSELPAVLGDTVNALTTPVSTVLEPVDDAVEGLTGLSLLETANDVTGLLPSSDATPVPLNEAVGDVLEPVVDLVEDPLEPVETLLAEPLEPVETLTQPVEVLTQPVETLTEPVEALTQPVLGPLLPPEPTPPPDGPAPTTTPPPDEAPCLLGLLLC